MLVVGGWVGGWALLMDLLDGQGGPLSYATRPPKEQGAAGDLRDPGAPPASDLVLAPRSLSPGGRGGQLNAPPCPIQPHSYLEADLLNRKLWLEKL